MDKSVSLKYSRGVSLRKPYNSISLS